LAIDAKGERERTSHVRRGRGENSFLGLWRRKTGRKKKRTGDGPRHGPEDGAPGRALGRLPDHGRPRGRAVVVALLRRRRLRVVLRLLLGRLRLEGGPQVHDLVLELPVLLLEGRNLFLEGGGLLFAGTLAFPAAREVGSKFNASHHALGLEPRKPEVVDEVGFGQAHQEPAVDRVVANLGDEMPQLEGNEEEADLVDAVVLGVLHSFLCFFFAFPLLWGRSRAGQKGRESSCLLLALLPSRTRPLRYDCDEKKTPSALTVA
jgi:hypothetical protein